MDVHHQNAAATGEKTPVKPTTSKRNIQWNERVRVRRFEKVSRDVAQHCYYTEAELHSFHQAYMHDDDEDDVETVESSYDVAVEAA